MILPFLRRRRIPVTEEDIGLLLTRDEDSLMHENFSELARTAIQVRRVHFGLFLVPFEFTVVVYQFIDSFKAECENAGSVAWVFTPREGSKIQCELVLSGERATSCLKFLLLHLASHE